MHADMADDVQPGKLPSTAQWTTMATLGLEPVYIEQDADSFFEALLVADPDRFAILLEEATGRPVRRCRDAGPGTC